MKKRKTKHSKGRRNAAPAAPRSAPRRPRLVPIPDPPDWKTAVASVVGGGGSALLGGWLAEKGWDQQMVGIAMTTGGVVGALALPGPWRVAANGVAASGAGQFALATVHKAAVARVTKQLGGGDGAKRNAFPTAVSDAFASMPYGYGSSLDDEERMTDPELMLHAA